MTDPAPLPGNHRTRRIHPAVVAATPVILLLAVAWLLYRPEFVRPFDFVDFPENVLILDAHEGFGGQFRALSRVYTAHGRWSPITFATIAAQWSLFERWTPGWQLFRFGVLSVVVVMAYQVFRRLRLTTIGAFAAASLLVVSPGAVVGWTRLSTAEPVGMVFLTAACLLAFQRRTFATASAFAMMLLGILWTKEVMTAAFLFPVILAAQAQQPATPEVRSTRRATFAWFVPSAVVFSLGAIPIVHTWASAPSDSFASRYGSVSFRLIEIVGASIAAWLPFAPIQADSLGALLLAITAFLVIVVVGWWEVLRSDMSRLERLILTAAIVVPVAGALVYAPWPFYLLIYALPFTVAGSLVLGQAASSLLRSNAAGRLTGVVALITVLTFCLAQAASESARTYALQDTFAASVRRVAVMPGIDTVLVGVESGQFDSRGNFSPRFRTYATMLGLEWPPVRDVPCHQLPMTPGAHVLVLRLNLMCEPTPSPQLPVVTHYNRFVWPNPMPRRDSVVVTFTAPALRDSLP